MKQIGTVVLLYAGDWNDSMPQMDKFDRLLGYAISRDPPENSWIWTCPERNTGLTYVTEKNPISYTFNRNGLAWTLPTDKKIFEIKRPAGSINITDGRENNSWGAWIQIDGDSDLFGYDWDTRWQNRTWFDSQGWKMEDTVYVPGANVDAQGGPSGTRYRHNINRATADNFFDGHAATYNKNEMQRGFYPTKW